MKKINLVIVMAIILIVGLISSCVGQVDGQECIGEDCVEAICNDGIDNDEDGKTDCADSDCSDDPACQSSNNSNNSNNVTTETICDDGIDNDKDGYTDCADADCQSDPVCDSTPDPEETICDDGIDNDNDGLTDCDDLNCANDGHCRELICDDSIDNDGDGLTDCLDKDCENASNCLHVDAERVCGDGISNDPDYDTDDYARNYVDCDDHDCITATECTGEDKFTDLLGMYPGNGTVGGCMNPLEPGDWDPACAGPVVMGNFHVIGDETKWAAAYEDQEACTAAGIRAYGIHYDRFQISVVDAPGGDFISADVICHAICGPGWDGVKAQVNIACFYRVDSAMLFNGFDAKVDDHDQSVVLDMARVILRRPAEK